MMRVLSIFLCLSSVGYGLDESALLRAVAIREGGSRMGKAGERGIYQMMPKTVRDSGGHDSKAAMIHLRWIASGLRSKGLAVCPFNLALAWNAGFTRATTGSAKMSSYEYARDVVSIYERITGQPSLQPVPAY